MVLCQLAKNLEVLEMMQQINNDIFAFANGLWNINVLFVLINVFNFVLMLAGMGEYFKSATSYM